MKTSEKGRSGTSKKASMSIAQHISVAKEDCVQDSSDIGEIRIKVEDKVV